MGDVDYSGADAMRQVNKAVTEHGARLVLSNVDMPVRKLLDAYGVTDLVGPSAIFPDDASVLVAYQATEPGADGVATAPPEPGGSLKQGPSSG
jgi:MFS superfamily sulfate permease-like transporter